MQDEFKSAEIEEMREKQRQEKLLETYLREAIAKQLDDRKLCYSITIMDPKSGAIMHGISGNPSQVAAMASHNVSTNLSLLVRQLHNASEHIKKMEA